MQTQIKATIFIDLAPIACAAAVNNIDKMYINPGWLVQRTKTFRHLAIKNKKNNQITDDV